MRSILIDPFARTITEVDYDGDYKKIYQKIDCQTFTTVSIGSPPDSRPLQHNGRENHVFVDDEGLLNNPRYFFLWKGYDQPLAGKGLILGCDEAGESIATTWSVDEVRAMVTFTELSVRGFKNIPAHTEIIDGEEFTVMGHQPLFGPPEDDEC